MSGGFFFPCQSPVINSSLLYTSTNFYTLLPYLSGLNGDSPLVLGVNARVIGLFFNGALCLNGQLVYCVTLPLPQDVWDSLRLLTVWKTDGVIMRSTIGFHQAYWKPGDWFKVSPVLRGQSLLKLEISYLDVCSPKCDKKKKKTSAMIEKCQTLLHWNSYTIYLFIQEITRVTLSTAWEVEMEKKNDHAGISTDIWFSCHIAMIHMTFATALQSQKHALNKKEY